MTIKIKDLINLDTAAKQMNTSIENILFDALEGKYQLFSLASEEQTIEMLPCKKEWIEEERFFIDRYNVKSSIFVETELGQVLKLNSTAVKGLIVNKSFSEVELFRELAPELGDSDYEYWKTSQELFRYEEWEDGKPKYNHVNLNSIFMLESDISNGDRLQNKTSTEAASNTSLKVIGLLLYHLAKSPKYASGSSPNKSQIKDLLLDLAQELSINQYGLSKVDERLLTKAIKYLETQKI